MESTVTAKTMRLIFVEFRRSTNEIEDADPSEYNNADDPYMKVNQMPENENAKCNFAQRYEKTANSEVSITPCLRSYFSC